MPLTWGGVGSAMPALRKRGGFRALDHNRARLVSRRDAVAELHKRPRRDFDADVSAGPPHNEGSGARTVGGTRVPGWRGNCCGVGDGGAVRHGGVDSHLWTVVHTAAAGGTRKITATTTTYAKTTTPDLAARFLLTQFAVHVRSNRSFARRFEPAPSDQVVYVARLTAWRRRRPAGRAGRAWLSTRWPSPRGPTPRTGR
jgi:hypothetical protein